jgi:hypothetical protein
MGKTKKLTLHHSKSLLQSQGLVDSKTTNRRNVLPPKKSEISLQGTTPKKKVVVQETPSRDVAGFGENVIKLTAESGEIVCFIGKIDGKEQVFFGKAVTPDQLEAVMDFLSRKKTQKYLEKDRFADAQEYANRKF